MTHSDNPQFGFAKPVTLDAPPESVTSDLIATGAIKDNHIASDAKIEQAKVKDLPRDLKAKLTKDGKDRMEGPLDMGNNTIKNLILPTADHHAANKKYVDDALLDAGLAFDPVDKAGDTMTGPLILSGDPVQDLGAATKQYVDQKLDNLGSGGDVFEGGNNNFTGNNTFQLPINLGQGLSAIGTSLIDGTLEVDGTLSVSGSAIFELGSVTKLGRHPVTNMDAATKQYVDDLVNSLNPGNVYTYALNTFTGNNVFNGSLSIGATGALDVQSSAFFHDLIEGVGGLNVQGPITLGQTGQNTDIFGTTTFHDPIVVNQTLTMAAEPIGEFEVATKGYVDNLIDSSLGLNISIVESLTHLPVEPNHKQMAYVETLAALYIYDENIPAWVPYFLNFFPNWKVTGATEVSVEVMGNDTATLVTLAPTGTTRFYLYRRSDLQIDAITTPPDMYNGIPGIIETAGQLNYVKPYIGSVLSAGSVLVKEEKNGRTVSRLETSVFANPVANNTAFVSLAPLSDHMPPTSNKAHMMCRLIVPSGGGPDLELYTRAFGDSSATGLLNAGHYHQSGSSSSGSYQKFSTLVSASKVFEYRFNRITTTACNFYFMGYEDII